MPISLDPRYVWTGCKKLDNDKNGSTNESTETEDTVSPLNVNEALSDSYLHHGTKSGSQSSHCEEDELLHGNGGNLLDNPSSVNKSTCNDTDVKKCMVAPKASGGHELNSLVKIASLNNNNEGNEDFAQMTKENKEMRKLLSCSTCHAYDVDMTAYIPCGHLLVCQACDNNRKWTECMKCGEEIQQRVLAPSSILLKLSFRPSSVLQQEVLTDNQLSIAFQLIGEIFYDKYLEMKAKAVLDPRNIPQEDAEFCPCDTPADHFVHINSLRIDFQSQENGNDTAAGLTENSDLDDNDMDDPLTVRESPCDKNLGSGIISRFVSSQRHESQEDELPQGNVGNLLDNPTFLDINICSKTDFAQMIRENKEMRRLLSCNTCQAYDVDMIAYIPCGHLFVCQTCDNNLKWKVCTKCGKEIKKRVAARL